MDKSLGLLAALAAGIGIYFLAETTPQGKKVISNIHQSISNIKTGITEVSTTPTQPDLSKGRCPKGMYLDQTDGIYRCHSAGRIRELSPNVKLFNPQWQNAWAEPNMTQPLVQPDINKQIESEIKKKHEKEVKHQKNLDSKRLIREHGNVVAAQVECPKDLTSVPCGGHCYKNGHLMAVDCSGQKNKPKKPSLVIPPNFPSQVVITPGEEPYPEDVGGPDNITDVNPSYPDLPHQPEIGPITPEPPRQPEIGPVTPEPPRQPQIGPLQPIGVPFHPFTNWKGFAGSAVNGCRQVNSHSGGSSFRSCRVVADNTYMKSKIGNNGYRIDCVLDIGEHTGEHNQECSITSGGPGSNKGLCCGFTARINLNNGTLRLESEDWSQGGTTGAKYCEGASCVNGGLSSITNGASVYGKKIKFSWVVTRNGNNATYFAEATGPAGTVRTNPITNPHAHKSGGPPIIPFQQISGGKAAEDSHRIRVDSAKTVNFNTPSVTVLSRTGYFGDYGYIDDEDFLI